MATIGFLLAAVPARAQWAVATVPGSYRSVASDPATGDLIVTTEDRKIIRLNLSTGMGQEVPDSQPDLDGFLPELVAVAPGGAIDCQWRSAGLHFFGSMIFRCHPGQKPRPIAGRKDKVGFTGDSPHALSRGCYIDDLAYGPDGEIFATAFNSHRVFMFYPMGKRGTRRTPGEDTFGIRTVAGSGREIAGLSLEEAAAALEKGRDDARRLPLTPTGIGITARGDILFTDYDYNKVFRLIPPAGERRSWTLESKAGSGRTDFNGGDHARASDANLNSPTSITIGHQGQIYVQTADERIWEFTPYEDKGHEEWRSRVLTFAGAGPDGKDSDTLPVEIVNNLSSLPDGRLVAVNRQSGAGLTVFTPPKGKAAAGDTKKD